MRPEAALVYSGKNSDAIEKEIVKFPTTVIPNKNIKIFFIIRFLKNKIPNKRKKAIIKL